MPATDPVFQRALVFLRRCQNDSEVNDGVGIKPTGDGGFAYNVMELATMVEQKIPLTAVVFNDNAYGNVAEAAFKQRATEASPALPVKALALPALTRIPRALPLPRFFRQRSTGAERVSDFVSTPAIVVPGANSISITSLRPL